MGRDRATPPVQAQMIMDQYMTVASGNRGATGNPSLLQHNLESDLATILQPIQDSKEAVVTKVCGMKDNLKYEQKIEKEYLMTEMERQEKDNVRKPVQKKDRKQVWEEKAQILDNEVKTEDGIAARGKNSRLKSKIGARVVGSLDSEKKKKLQIARN
ncbi:hypothetical protein NDU88_003812 [Pleurodeles waltl]|uniref:Uncharacterized protein n=1 Tax=Pleurodeles waltl TaxID=8319 RepID=A0AAV7RJM2_PLEWA|nr:hypothetical protein NDU88_003812 [Pleurodeles waltl]